RPGPPPARGAAPSSPPCWGGWGQGRRGGSSPTCWGRCPGGAEGVTWVNAVVQGVFLGGFYALLACGLSIMFGVMRIINLAHGDLALLGAYGVWLLLARLDVPPYVALVIVLPVMLAVGYVLQVGILDRSLRSGVLTPLLAPFGLSVVLQNLLLIAFSPDVRSLGGNAGAATTASWRLSGELSIPLLGVLIPLVAVLIVRGLPPV